MRKADRRVFTGKHMAAILVTFFGVVIGVNLVMAHYASSTFGGLVVENSYVASQKFNGWLERAREEKALGWTLDAGRETDGRMLVTLSTAEGPIDAAHLSALVRHPLGRAPERTLRFHSKGEGRYESIERLPAGRWIVHLEARADGDMIRRIVDLQ